MKYKNEILNLEKNGYAIFKSVIPKNFLDKLSDIISKLEYKKQISVRVKMKLPPK